MAEIKKTSLKRSMAITYLITICVIGILSGLTIYFANRTQQEIQRNRYGIVKDPDFIFDESYGGYHLDYTNSTVEWHDLSSADKVAFYSLYVVMIGLPILYLIIGFGVAAKIFYQKRLRTPIEELQKAIDSIQNNDLDFTIAYNGNDELGHICSSMEKMRSELCQNNKKLWRTLEERKLLNASVAHDLRTPITVMKGYIDFLQTNIPQDKVTEDSLMDTLYCMKAATSRLESYVDCVRDIEKLESIEICPKPENTQLLLEEMEYNIPFLTKEKTILLTSNITASTIYIDKNVLFRILDNLLLNALRYAEAHVDIDISQKENSLIITVKDDGKGFTDEDLMKATSLFYTNNEEKEHFGIGLSICKMLCEKQNGTLYLSNREEKGACIIAEIGNINSFSKN